MKIESNNPTATEAAIVARGTVVKKDVPPSGESEINELGTLEKAQKALKDGTYSFEQVANSLKDAGELEFLLVEAMIIIVKSKLDEFERNMKDSIDQSRLGMEFAKDQAEDIREAGGMALGAGIAGGIMSIAGAGVSAAGAGVSMKSSMSTGEFNMGKFQSTNQGWMGVSTATNSVGQISSSAMKYTESTKQADSEIDKSLSGKQLDASGRTKDLAKNENDFIQQLIQMIMQLGDMQHEARSKVIG